MWPSTALATSADEFSHSKTWPDTKRIVNSKGRQSFKKLIALSRSRSRMEVGFRRDVGDTGS